MAFVEMNRGDGKFVCWGKEKAKDNSYIVEKGQSITGMVMELRDSHAYGKIMRIKTKECEDTLIVLGTTILIDRLGYEKVDKTLNTYENNIKTKANVEPVKENDVVRITFVGMTPTKRGKAAYDIKVEVDRP
jgi:hypothetical protein